MKTNSFKTVEIHGFDIAYREQGEGDVFLLVHGFAASSLVWQPFIDQMPSGYRCIAIDLKGFGESFKAVDDHLSLFNQADIISGFVEKLKLESVNIVAHSSGAICSLIAMFDSQFEQKVKQLFVVASDGFLRTLPNFINQARQLINDRLFYPKLINKALVKSLLIEAFYNPERISNDIINSYLNALQKLDSKKSILASARQMEIGHQDFFLDQLRKLTKPIQLILGDHDSVIDRESLKLFQDALGVKEVHQIPECGHLPHQEQPQKLVELIFNQATKPQSSITILPRKGRLRRLIDGFDPAVIFLVAGMKVLQITHRLFFRVEYKGWRHLSGIFLRSDHSKFVLTAFRLNYRTTSETIEDFAMAKKQFISKWMKFHHGSEALHWHVHYKGMYTFSRKTKFTDLVEATYNSEGRLTKLEPHFDDQAEKPLLDPFLQEKVLEIIIQANNHTSHLTDPKRYKKMIKRIKWQQRKLYQLSLATRAELKNFSKRILEATFINFSLLTSNRNQGRERLASPPFPNLKHPGVGLTNIHCRITPNFQEADLWCQFHHVPVDGMIMQQQLDRLKGEWGTAGRICFPTHAQPEITSFHHGKKEIFQGRAFFDFAKINRVRKQLNHLHLAEMGGPATVVSLLTWGVTQHKCLRKHKIAFPVDLMDLDQSGESETTLMFIRPSAYFTKRNQRESFYAYQTEFNQRLYATRTREGENYQVLELFAVTNKFIQFLGKNLFKQALGRAVGSVGISIVKNAEIILPPASDLQSNGFITIGNFWLPTENENTKVGCLSIRGTQRQVEEYLDAFQDVFSNFENYLSELSE
jgi:pimeloyl-ACP methyl ester carboxylesterase